ncbi:hypothetical protein C8J56DRAFT_491990 [Mycena floridula]|nr:hypothetical protein C8J56DRAFT_491990 [Mycena floridula]
MLRNLSQRTLARRASTHRFYSPPGRIPTQLFKAQIPLSASYLNSSRAFHSSRRNEGLPLLPLLATVLKTSTALELARTAGRIVLTFVPIVLVKNARTRHYLKELRDGEATAGSEEKQINLIAKIRSGQKLFHFLLAIPTVLIFATILASMERTPLTGRWRMIVLSPEEEDEIAAQLAGPGWYSAVGEILQMEGSTRFIPPDDWRFIWVMDTLRRLEATIPILTQEGTLRPDWLSTADVDGPLPPPTQYPLRPRPRASEYLRTFCENLCHRMTPPVPHTIPGPPYSLLVVEKPESSNAFSYGFGPNGGGGIVVYSGFLDDIFSRVPPASTRSESQSSSSWLTDIFGGLFSYNSPSHPIPTPEQTGELSILLAHELAHLVLSHHLETLSSATVFIPGTVSIVADIFRVLIFPVTMLFGPFVNDAVAQIGKIGSGELLKIGDYCTSVKQEIEADVVSARLLAHAGFDARNAVTFWENRSCQPTECAHAEEIDSTTSRDNLSRSIMGSKHPVNETRVECLKRELVRWETERRAALLRLQSTPQNSSIMLSAA